MSAWLTGMKDCRVGQREGGEGLRSCLQSEGTTLLSSLLHWTPPNLATQLALVLYVGPLGWEKAGEQLK